jgi:cytochrome c
MFVRMRLSHGCWLSSALVFVAMAASHAQSVPAASVPVSTPRIPSAAQSPIQGDAERGKALYQGCSACHSIDENDIGPKHRGVVGRTAGTVPDYAYSAALKASGIVWNKVTLDRWLTNPSAMVPGTKMFFLLPDPQNRADVIAYLAELK